MLWTALISSLLVLGVEPTESETTTPETAHLLKRTPSMAGSTVSLMPLLAREMGSPWLSSEENSSLVSVRRNVDVILDILHCEVCHVITIIPFNFS